MSAVLGIDPSLTGTGIAWIEKGGPLHTCTLRSTGRRGDNLDARAQRLEGLATETWETLDEAMVLTSCELAVIEGPSHGSVGGSAWDRAGLWWRYVQLLHVAEIPVAVCAPTTRIKWATGSGRATTSTKSDVAVALSRLWPEADAQGDNEWDALAMATIGAQYLDWPVPSRAHHAASVAKVAWPEWVRS